MTYRDRLQPWCIIRHLPDSQCLRMARFRRRSDAEAHLQALRQLLPTTPHSLIFDGSDLDDLPVEEIKASLRRSLHQAKAGQRIPLSQAWQDLEAE